jgi:hypothetical protein
MTKILPFASIAGLLLIAGCQTAYYETMEKFGVEKRDILVDRVEEARDAQQDTKEEFTSALEEFSALVNYEGGDLEETYDTLKDKFERSENAAEDVRERIDKIESVGTALFKEWEEEIAEYSSDKLRRQSREAKARTQESYGIMVQKMRQAEATMYPVLDLFRDQVLFLKHNLNARAIASLDTQAVEIEDQVKRLIAEMEESIQVADAFITSMR